MSNDTGQTSRTCPDCGHENPPDAVSCEHCNFPLDGPGGPPADPGTPPKPKAKPKAKSTTRIEPPPRLRRARERRQVRDPSLTLWLVVGILGAIVLLYMAVQGFHKNNFPQVEGAKPDQQARADQFRQMIDRDSTNVDARIGLADVLYDTGNWPQAIIQYRAALRMDSTRVNALVDLGVCYYNLGFTDQAADHFARALERDPQQTVALFNMGIISEHRRDPTAALQYYHRALQTNTVEDMRQTIMDAIARAQKAAGVTAPPLPGG